jgi:hypothetical protein
MYPIYVCTVVLTDQASWPWPLESVLSPRSLFLYDPYLLLFLLLLFVNMLIVKHFYVIMLCVSVDDGSCRQSKANANIKTYCSDTVCEGSWTKIDLKTKNQRYLLILSSVTNNNLCLIARAGRSLLESLLINYLHTIESLGSLQSSRA